jgi:putative acetyltransferase
MPRIVSVDSAEALRQVSELFREYAASLGVDLSFQDFDRELASLPGDYAPPTGRLFLAFVDDFEETSEAEQTRVIPSASLASGCIALRKFSGHVCEMKRLYVRPQFRGHGVGRALAETIIGAAREIGYRRMRLDTLPQMKQAQTLYCALGFREIPPYRHNPVPGTRYFELALC